MRRIAMTQMVSLGGMANKCGVFIVRLIAIHICCSIGYAKLRHNDVETFKLLDRTYGAISIIQ